MAIGIASLFLSSCKTKTSEGLIIFTRSAGANANIPVSDSVNYTAQSQIVELNPEKPSVSLKILTSDFYSAREPRISNDGNTMLFSAIKKENDKWQIWEMDLNNLKSIQLTDSKENYTDPA
jgi:Tol biopolymer transport system component